LKYAVSHALASLLTLTNTRPPPFCCLAMARTPTLAHQHSHTAPQQLQGTASSLSPTGRMVAHASRASLREASACGSARRMKWSRRRSVRHQTREWRLRRRRRLCACGGANRRRNNLVRGVSWFRVSVVRVYAWRVRFGVCVCVCVCVRARV
jgi:hypothetical protein